MTAPQDIPLLDRMTLGIMAGKQEKASKLTPVGAEAGGPLAGAALPRTPAPFPNDKPQEVVEQTIAELERQVVHLQEVIAALRLVAGKPAEVAQVDDVKAKERAADESFKARQQRLAEEAQASLATVLSATPTEELSPVIAAALVAADAGGGPVEVMQAAMGAAGWQCPEHGDTVQVLKSRKGREYRACTKCKEFERA